MEWEQLEELLARLGVDRKFIQINQDNLVTNYKTHLLQSGQSRQLLALRNSNLIDLPTYDSHIQLTIKHRLKSLIDYKYENVKALFQQF